MFPALNLPAFLFLSSMKSNRGNGNRAGQMRTAFTMPPRSRSILSLIYTAFNTTLSRPRALHFRIISQQQPFLSIGSYHNDFKYFVKAIQTCSKPSLLEIWDLVQGLTFALDSGWIIFLIFKSKWSTKRYLMKTKGYNFVYVHVGLAVAREWEGVWERGWFIVQILIYEYKEKSCQQHTCQSLNSSQTYFFFPSG